jgi:anti-sigma regulatory factor (Ser/Thr protein kinase)
MSAAEVAKPEMRVFLGSASQVRGVRDFVREMVAGCPVADDVILLASEVATNAIVHTASGKGGTFTVVVMLESGLVRVEVHDDGSEGAPDVGTPRTEQESGSGLYLVDVLATRWGHLGGRDGRVVWFEMDWP